MTLEVLARAHRQMKLPSPRPRKSELEAQVLMALDFEKYISRLQNKGPSIKYVHTEGGRGGVCPKADIVLEISKGGCVIWRTRGGGGPKTRNFCGRT